MSVRVLDRVFRGSRATGNDRVVLLVLADHASDDGSRAYPSQRTIARKAGGIAERTVRYSLERLEGLGEIEREGLHPVTRTVSYRVTVTTAKLAERDGSPPALMVLANLSSLVPVQPTLRAGGRRPPAAD